MNVYFLLNPSKPKRRPSYERLAAAAAHAHHLNAFYGHIDRRDPRSMQALLAEAMRRRCRRIVVVGGDGTFHRLINLLSAKGRLKTVELGVVPAGTCNDFARALGLSKRRPEAAFEAACTGSVQAMDLALMDHELFFNNAGVGRRPLTSRLPTKPLKTIRSFRVTPLRVKWESGSLHGRFFLGLVCNQPYFSGGLHFPGPVHPADGLLDVFLVPAMAKWRLLPMLVGGKLGRPVKTRGLVALRVKTLEIASRHDLWPQADGEPPGPPVRRVRFSVAREQAMIVIPKTARWNTSPS